jgi:hypothetical protein
MRVGRPVSRILISSIMGVDMTAQRFVCSQTRLPFGRGALVLAAALLSLAAAPRAMGAPIGAAVIVEGQVSGSAGGETRRLAVGDGVVSNEVVRTREQSDGQLRFLDRTKLFVGPLSQVTLNRFVFDPDRDAGRFSVSLGRGALRFVSGRAPKGGYQVNVPFGSLGLRGTVVDAVTQPGRVIVSVKEGLVDVRPRRGRGLTLAAGQSAILTARGVVGPLDQASVPDFGTACAGCTLLAGATDLRLRRVLPPRQFGHEPPTGGGDGSGNSGSSGSSR